MCNLILFWRILEDYPVIALHSRYEKSGRLEEPPRAIKYPYTVYAPLDVPSRGSWIGINEERVLGGITNQYSTINRRKKRSRGTLLIEALGNSKNAKEMIKYMKKELRKGYKTANFLIADEESAFHLIYDKKISVKRLKPGKHVITPLTPLEDKEMNKRLSQIRTRAKKRKERSFKLFETVETGNIQELLEDLKTISRDHHEGRSQKSICYHDPEGKMEQTSATIIAVDRESLINTKILYCPQNPCENTYIDYSHILRGGKFRGGELQVKSEKLEGKRIAICVTGSVASILSPKLARELRRYGAKVRCYMTKSAVEHGVPSNVMEWATGNKVVTDLTGKVEHLEKFDTVIVYPATYNTIGKIAEGIADTPVTTLCGATEKDKIIIAPAMSLELWTSPFLKENIDKLKSKGVQFITPYYKEGIAKVAGIEEVADQAIRKSWRTKLQGRNVLILAGPTRADIDPIRYISNKSTGKLGYQLVRESVQRGCEATVIYGPGQVEMPKRVNVKQVYTTEEMLEEAIKELERKPYEIAIFAAAILDFTIKRESTEKIRSGQPIELQLEPTAKVIRKVQKSFPDLFTVGFKLEFNINKEDLIKKGYEALEEQGSDIIVANDLAKIYGEHHPAYILDKGKNIQESRGYKEDLAEAIFDAIEERI